MYKDCYLDILNSILNREIVPNFGLTLGLTMAILERISSFLQCIGTISKLSRKW